MAKIKYFDGSKITIKQSYSQHHAWFAEDEAFKGGEVFVAGGESTRLENISFSTYGTGGVLVYGVDKTDGTRRSWRFGWDAIEERIAGEEYVRDFVTREMVPRFACIRVDGVWLLSIAADTMCFICTVCGKHHFTTNMREHFTPEGALVRICERCYTHMRRCSVCGHEFVTGEMEKIAGKWVCRCCAEAAPYKKRHDGVTGYKHTTGLSFFDYAKRAYIETAYTSDTPFLGVELEVEHGEVPDEDANSIKNFYPMLGVETKSDSSLGWGSFEVVTQPMTLNAHTKGNFWKRALALLTREGYQSYDGGRCGLHVHIGRNFFGTKKESSLDAAVKMNLIFVNNYNWIVKFSRRSTDTLADWAEIPEYEEFGDIEDYTYSADSRYRAVNVTRDDTIEIRIFRGSLKVTTVLAAIEFVGWLARFVKEHDIEECEDLRLRTADFGKYPNLINYVSERGLV